MTKRSKAFSARTSCGYSRRSGAVDGEPFERSDGDAVGRVMGRTTCSTLSGLEMVGLSVTSILPGTRVTTAVFVTIVLVASGSLLWVTIGIDDGEEPDQQFEAVGARMGIDYVGTADKRATFGNGRAGVYVLDFDRDSRPDVLAIGGDGPVLFENTGGRFDRRSLSAVDNNPKSALVFDYDNDGWQDLLFLPVQGEPTFFENDRGTFAAREVGFDREIHIGMAATAGDYDADGCLDVFIAQNGDWRAGPPLKVRIETIEEEYGSEATKSLRRKPDNGNPNLLYDGDCSSFERAADAGVNGTKWSVATSMADFTGDGHPDIHVANDFNNNTLYVNRGNGSFRRVAIPDTNRNGMSSELEDVNRDGRLDAFVTNVHFDRRPLTVRALPGMSNEGNNLLINRGNGTFTSEEETYGVTDGGWGWASVLADLDNDRDRDLVHTTRNYVLTTGSEETETLPSVWERTGLRNFTRRNATEQGFVTSNGKGMVNLDFDLDGDQDLLVADDDGRYKLYENRARDGDGDDGNYLQIRPVTTDGRTAYGAEVSVSTGGETRIAVENTKTDFLSQDTRFLHFGLGANDSATFRVEWPDGTARTFEVDVNQRLLVTPDGTLEAVPDESGARSN
jgi:outer membrane lipoprotein-sorting protein